MKRFVLAIETDQGVLQRSNAVFHRCLCGECSSFWVLLTTKDLFPGVVSSPPALCMSLLLGKVSSWGQEGGLLSVGCKENSMSLGAMGVLRFIEPG